MVYLRFCKKCVHFIDRPCIRCAASKPSLADANASAPTESTVEEDADVGLCVCVIFVVVCVFSLIHDLLTW